MFVECAKMKGRSPYLRVAETYSVAENGQTKIKKRIVRNIGPLPKFDDGLPDFVGRLKKSFKDGAPIIKELRYCGRHALVNESISREVQELPMKKVRKEKIEYMSNEAVTAILNSPDNRSAFGRRNKALLSLLYDSAARVQELVDIEIGDLYLSDKAGMLSDPFVTLHGKGGKLRNVNLSPKTAMLILSYMDEFHTEAARGTPLFYTRRNGSLWPLSVDSVSRILKENADSARVNVPDVPERVHCHLLRKSRAMHLYIAGVPLPAIMELLGHASMDTTSGFYAFVTWEMVSEAMKKANEGQLEGEKIWKGTDVIKQLYSLE